MKNPLQTFGFQVLTSSKTGEPALPRLSRRGFIALSASLGSSCSMISSAKPDAGGDDLAKVDPGSAPARTTANTTYRTPKVQGPVPRNPDMNLPSSGASSGITFSRVSVAQPYIAITFDDGPHPKYTPRLVDILRERNI